MACTSVIVILVWSSITNILMLCWACLFTMIDECSEYYNIKTLIWYCSSCRSCCSGVNKLRGPCTWTSPSDTISVNKSKILNAWVAKEHACCITVFLPQALNAEPSLIVYHHNGVNDYQPPPLTSMKTPVHMYSKRCFYAFMHTFAYDEWSVSAPIIINKQINSASWKISYRWQNRYDITKVRANRCLFVNSTKM